VDGSGNKADEFFVQVFVRDVIPPVIVLNGSPEVSVDVFGTFNDPGVTATDNITLNPSIVTDRSTALNLNKLGKYTVTYTASDGSQNRASVKRTINVVDRTAPVLTLLTPNPFRMDINDDFDTIDPGYKVTDNYWPEDSIEIAVDKSKLITSQTGMYFVYYQATDRSGNVSPSRFRRVEVTFRIGLNKLTLGSNMFKIYPNPTAGKFTVNSDVKIHQIKIYGTDGRLVDSISTFNNGGEIDIKERGIFMLVIETEDGVYTHKMLVN
jgi:hypothetical protein